MDAAAVAREFAQTLSERIAAHFGDELAGYELDKGTIRFPLDEPVPAALIGRIAKFLAAQARKHRGDGAARLLARRDHPQRDLRMAREQPQELDPRVASAADDARLDHVPS